MNHNVVFRWDLSICPVEIVEIINNIRSSMAGYGVLSATICTLNHTRIPALQVYP